MCNNSQSRWRRFNKFEGASLVIPLLLIVWSSVSHGLELDGALGAGFDSNPSRTPDGDGYALTRLRASVQESWPELPLDSELSLSADTMLDGFENGDRRSRWRVEGRWQQAMLDGWLRPALAVDGVRYRDDFAPEDERDELSAALELLMVVSASHELTLSGAYDRLDYSLCVSPGGGPTNFPTSAEGAGSGKWGSACADGEREDRLSTFGLAWTAYPEPGVTEILRTWQAHNRSELEAESYRQWGLGASLEIEGRSGWGGAAGVLWRSSSYDDDSQGRREARKDRTATLSLALTKQWGDFDLFAELRVENNHSSLGAEKYREELIWLGLSRAF